MAQTGTQEIQKYSPDLNTWTYCCTTPQLGVSLCCVNNTMFAAGGFDASVWYRDSHEVWHRCAQKSGVCMYPALLPIRDTIYIVRNTDGGWGLDSYDVQQKCWVTCCNPIGSWPCSDGVAVGSDLLLLGGQPREVKRFKSQTREWSRGQRLPEDTKLVFALESARWAREVSGPTNAVSGRVPRRMFPWTCGLPSSTNSASPWRCRPLGFGAKGRVCNNLIYNSFSTWVVLTPAKLAVPNQLSFDADDQCAFLIAPATLGGVAPKPPLYFTHASYAARFAEDKMRIIER